MSVAWGYRRSPSAFPRDGTQAYAALGFLSRAARARLREWNAVLALAWRVSAEERAEWAAIEAANATRSSTNDAAEVVDAAAEKRRFTPLCT